MTIYGIIPCNVNVMRANLKGESRAHDQAIQLRPVLACFRLEFDHQSCVKFSCDLRQFKCTVIKLSYYNFEIQYGEARHSISFRVQVLETSRILMRSVCF